MHFGPAFLSVHSVEVEIWRIFHELLIVSPHSQTYNNSQIYGEYYTSHKLF